jgi:hypothetical protein
LDHVSTKHQALSTYSSCDSPPQHNNSTNTSRQYPSHTTTTTTTSSSAQQPAVAQHMLQYVDIRDCQKMMRLLLLLLMETCSKQHINRPD